MEIAAGKMTALVGPSGSGKTSCLSLLKRLYEPQEGEILLDGKPLHHYTCKYLHQKVPHFWKRLLTNTNSDAAILECICSLRNVSVVFMLLFLFPVSWPWCRRIWSFFLVH